MFMLVSAHMFPTQTTGFVPGSYELGLGLVNFLYKKRCVLLSLMPNAFIMRRELVGSPFFSEKAPFQVAEVLL